MSHLFPCQRLTVSTKKYWSTWTQQGLIHERVEEKIKPQSLFTKLYFQKDPAQLSLFLSVSPYFSEAPCFSIVPQVRYHHLLVSRSRMWTVIGLLEETESVNSQCWHLDLGDKPQRGSNKNCPFWLKKEWSWEQGADTVCSSGYLHIKQLRQHAALGFWTRTTSKQKNNHPTLLTVISSLDLVHSPQLCPPHRHTLWPPNTRVAV